MPFIVAARFSISLKGLSGWVVLATTLAMALQPATAQAPAPKQLVQQAVANEDRADQADHSRWIYRDHLQEPGKNLVQVVVETADGHVKKTIESDGRPLDAAQRKQDDANMQHFADDADLREKQRKEDRQDARKAHEMMSMLADGFLWTQAAETADTVTLKFEPNPAFQPPSREARVFAAMAGTMVIDRRAMRIQEVSGRLTAPVDFGWGLLGKLRAGGTFRIVRSQVGPGVWRTTETHVHIQGRAILFKTINEQEDDEESDFKPAPAGLSLAQAIQMLQNGTAEKTLGVAASGNQARK
jgi:hypothetical protein